MNRSSGRRLIAGLTLVLLMAWPASAQATPVAGAPAETHQAASSSSDRSGALAPQRWTWSAPRQVSTNGPTEFVAVSCGSATSCLAADQGGFYHRWNGRTWSLADRHGFSTDGVFENYRVSSLSCTSAKFCASVEVFSDDAAHPTGSVVFWDGKRRAASRLPDGWTAGEISCTSPRSCIALPDGFSAGWARWDGTSWQVRDDDSFFDHVGLTCATATLCLASQQYGGKVDRFTGTSWVVEDAIPRSTLSCLSTFLCLAIGDDGVTRRFTGSGWVVAPTPPVGGALSCSRPTRCLDVGLASYSVYDGRRWSAPSSVRPAPPQGLVSCVRASFCAAAGGNRLAQFEGRRWSRATRVGEDPAPLAHVSCAKGRFCVGVGTYEAHQFGPAGQTGRTRLGLPMDPPSTVTGVSCATATFCVATTAQAMPSDVVHVFDGSAWQTVAAPADTVNYPAGVSCASRRFCATVGGGEGGGTTILYDGTSWRYVSAPQLNRISCVSATFCLGTGAGAAGSVSSVFDGTAWSAPASFGRAGGAAPVSVSCASTRLCVAVDPDGRAATYRGARWSSFAAVRGGPLVAVSCHGPTTCQAVSSTGNVVRHLGTSWSRPKHLSGLTTPTDISCPSAKACTVVDDSGQAVFGRA